MPFATVGDIQMFYQDLGVPGGRPVVMIHGFTGVAAIGRTRFPPLIGSGGWRHVLRW
jgi:pimeloyl-ACP methyl ester carboxylesterase